MRELTITELIQLKEHYVKELDRIADFVDDGFKADMDNVEKYKHQIEKIDTIFINSIQDFFIKTSINKK